MTEAPRTPAPADEWFAPLQVKGNFTPETLDGYFTAVQDWLRKDMTFLRAPIDWWREMSNWTRGLGFIAVAAGVLLPMPILPSAYSDLTGIEMGYLAAVAGGLVLLLDRLFNVSSSWMRLTLAEMQLKQVRYRLDLDWAKRRPLLTAENGATEGPALIELLRAAVDAGHQIMESQKKTWTTELSQALESLRTRLDADRVSLAQLRADEHRDAANPKTGGVTVTIDKPQDLVAPVTISVGAKEQTLPIIPASWPIVDLPAGLTTVAVEAKRVAPAGSVYLASKLVTVAAGEAKAVAFEV